ncbi:DNA repair protein rad51c [Massospora cicadina]|nr:DNA repair protein rad51c [Massospora cicadina]
MLPFGGWFLEHCNPIPGSITEVCGRTSSGKTPVCHAVAAYFLVSHWVNRPRGRDDLWANPVVYIDTGNDFSGQSLAFHLRGLIAKLDGEPDVAGGTEACLASVSLFRPSTADELLTTLDQIEWHALARRNCTASSVKLLVVDPSLRCCRRCYDPTRTGLVIQALRRVGVLLACPILVTNTLIRRYTPINPSPGFGPLDTEVLQFQPSLGVTHPYLIDTQILVARGPSSTFRASILKTRFGRDRQGASFHLGPDGFLTAD